MSTRKAPLRDGERLVQAVLEQMAADGLEPDARDRALLDTAQQLADRMAALQLLVGEDGERAVSATGVVRLHPGIAEYRQHAVALSKVLSAVSLVETSGHAKNPDKVRAAETRWRPHNIAKAGA
jgi:hypothetical protein